MMKASPLKWKLRISAGILVFFVLLGSLIAYLKIREVSRISRLVTEQRIPLVNALRDTRLYALNSSSSLKSYILFGMDPEMGARYKEERNNSWQKISQAKMNVEKLIASQDYGSNTAVRDTLNDLQTLQALQAKVESMAIGQGADATGQAYDMLRIQLAALEKKLFEDSTSALNAANHSIESEMKQLNHTTSLVAIVLWSATLIGIISGGVASQVLSTRIVNSVQLVVHRAGAIAEGDLTGEPLDIRSKDEIATLADSVNSMQENLRTMLGEISDISEILHKNTSILLASANTNFTRTEEQTQQTHQAAAAMQEMSISIAEVSKHSNHAAESARHASSTAREGGAIVETMLASMESIAGSVKNTAVTVQRLGKESEQIIKIVNVIEDIAQKTNLLALNAAIEAARAGEQGRGFAVVAGEVRRLAESTGEATSEIAKMIDGIREHTMSAVEAMETGTARVEEGMATTNRAGEALEQIISMSDQVDNMIAQIATASSQQASAAQQSSANLDVISKLSTEGSADIPETQRIISALENRAQGLQEQVQRFRLNNNNHYPSNPNKTMGERRTRVNTQATAFGD